MSLARRVLTNSKLYWWILPFVTILYWTPGVVYCLQLIVVHLMSRGILLVVTVIIGVIWLCSYGLRLVLGRVTSFCLSSRPGACLIFFQEDIRLNALLSCAEIVTLTPWILPSVFLLCAPRMSYCLWCARCAYGRILAVTRCMLSVFLCWTL